MQHNNPLHKITLQTLLEELLVRHRWQGLGERVAIRCFTHEPSVSSSLKFLRRTPWARAQVEQLYLEKPSRDELQRAYDAWPSFARTVTMLVRRLPDERRETPTEAEFTEQEGMTGDRWASGKRLPGEQVSLMETRVARAIRGPLELAGDNLIVDLDLSEAAMPTGTILRIGTTQLQVTDEPHTGCKKFIRRFGIDAQKWINTERPSRRRGVYARVMAAGTARVGDAIET